MNDTDNLDEPLEQVLQHGMAIASQLGREVSRMWQQRMEEKAKMAEREARRLQMAYDADKGTALAALKPTGDSKWWDQAKPKDVVEAYRIANTWKDHDPAAAQAEKNIRDQAQARYGIDGEALADGKGATAPEVEPRHEQARDAEAQAILDRTEGNQQSTVAAAEYARADNAREEAATAEHAGPTADEEAWYREQFLTSSPESLESESRATDANEAVGQSEHAGDKATIHAGAAYNSAERQEALAARMRDAGAPEKGIAARQFAESQQKHPIDHAAAGQGKSVNKVKTTAPQKVQSQAKQKSR